MGAKVSISYLTPEMGSEALPTTEDITRGATKLVELYDEAGLKALSKVHAAAGGATLYRLITADEAKLLKGHFTEVVKPEDYNPSPNERPDPETVIFLAAAKPHFEKIEFWRATDGGVVAIGIAADGHASCYMIAQWGKEEMTLDALRERARRKSKTENCILAAVTAVFIGLFGLMVWGVGQLPSGGPPKSLHRTTVAQLCAPVQETAHVKGSREWQIKTSAGTFQYFEKNEIHTRKGASQTIREFSTLEVGATYKFSWYERSNPKRLNEFSNAELTSSQELTTSCPASGKPQQ